MATTTQSLSYEQFHRLYEHGDKAHEYWFGEAIPKGLPTWIHGLLQNIVMSLLTEARYIAASEVELRIDPNAYPKPDVIATKTQLPLGPYPTEALDVVIEIISEDDRLPHLKEKCRSYEKWGFTRIYLVDPSDRSVSEWQKGALNPVRAFVDIAAEKIWTELDAQQSRLT